MYAYINEWLNASLQCKHVIMYACCMHACLDKWNSALSLPHHNKNAQSSWMFTPSQAFRQGHTSSLPSIQIHSVLSKYTPPNLHTNITKREKLKNQNRKHFHQTYTKPPQLVGSRTFTKCSFSYINHIACVEHMY